ncbi:pectate lyase-like adhesive domain-containing protein [Listeria kieliensis]|uniref:pectate lyase-like adhesive domain-containing protein n=1 Tax=Listeria kieliensis TaxID=1621700 RepID=UPI000E217E4F|nr:pectate lyase-like adhesive domain-containing protein [Listeria kieliensis]
MGKKRGYRYFVIGCLVLIFGLALPIGISGLLNQVDASKSFTLEVAKEYSYANEAFTVTASADFSDATDTAVLDVPKGMRFLSKETQTENESSAIQFDEKKNQVVIPAKAFNSGKAKLLFLAKKAGDYSLIAKKYSNEKAEYSNNLKVAVVDRTKAKEKAGPEDNKGRSNMQAAELPQGNVARTGTVAYVTNATEMDAAMANTSVGEIVVMNDFAFTQFSSPSAGEANVAAPVRDLVIRGVRPGIKVDFRQRSYWLNFNMTKINVQVYDLDMYGQNYWGPFRLQGYTAAASSYSIQDVNYTGSQFTASYQADFSVAGTVVNKSVNSYVSPFDGVRYNTQPYQTNLEVTNITFKENSHYTGTTDNATVLMLGTGGTIGTATVEKGAVLNLTGGGDGFSGEGAWTTIQLNGNLHIANNAEVNIKTPTGSSRGGILLGNGSEVLVSDGATLNLEMNGPFTDAYYKNPISIGDSAKFDVESGAHLSVIANNQGAGNASLVKTGNNSTFKIGKKGTFVVSSDGSAAKNMILIGAASTFTFADAGGVDLDARRNTNPSTRLIWMASGTFNASIQRVKAWSFADASKVTPTYDWYPMYGMTVSYSGSNVISATGKSISNTIAASFVQNYRTQNFKRVLYDYIPDVKVMIDSLSDNHKEVNSHVIHGVSNPGAWVTFTGDSAIPPGTIKGQAEGDTKKYHVRADAKTGEFTFVLPEGNYLTAGNKVWAYAYLNGKESLTSVVVADKTPPDKPVLNTIKDKDANLVGTAEANSLVTIYRASDKAILGSTKANAKGSFTLALTANQKPLVPYLEYYAVAKDAAGNESVKSDIKTVQDTTPPNADAVTQFVQVGSNFDSDVKALVTNVQDNAGNGDDNLSYKLVKSPDTELVGKSEAIVEIADKAGNKVSISVPVFVKDQDSSISNEAMLRAEGFVVKAREVPVNDAELDAFILKQAKAKAWEVPSGSDISDSIAVADRGGFSKEARTYTITLRVKDVEKTIQVVVTPGTLSIKKIPADIQFGIQKIRSFEQRIKPEEETKVTVEDGRSERTGWQLTAMLESPFKTDGEEELPDSLVLATKNTDGNIRYTPINTQGTTPVFQKETASEGLTEIDLNPTGDTGLMLDLMPGNIRSGKLYQTKVVWTLENTP